MPHARNHTTSPPASSTLPMTKRSSRPPIDLELTLGSWTAKGSTVAEHDGRRIAIDRGIPGERVLAHVDRRSRQWRGVVQQTIEPSPIRIPAPCPYYHVACGGCQWQHLS